MFRRHRFFEFWGERNEKTFTDILIYTPIRFRTETCIGYPGSGSGARMVEETAVSLPPATVSLTPGCFFRTPNNIERDAHFDRFGQANQEAIVIV
ncbi:MAG: hypothetical protein R3C26_22420 [Calditrichia bacterium]